MRYPALTCCSILLTLGSLLSPAAAETLHERVALSLSGPDCSSQRPSIGAALAQIPGVSRVDFESVPDHVLVDVARGRVMPEALKMAAAGTMMPGVQCLADIMKSCISAGPLPAQH